MRPPPFWETKTLAEMSDREWESLCDGCARCCTLKLDDEAGNVYFTSVVCHMLDHESCRCRHYPDRHELVADCVEIDADNIGKLNFLPKSCAYRRIAEGRGLAWWHPLVSGSRDTVHAAGISVRGKVVSESGVHPDELERYIIRWVEA